MKINDPRAALPKGMVPQFFLPMLYRPCFFFSKSANRQVSAIIVKVGFELPPVGKTEQLAT